MRLASPWALCLIVFIPLVVYIVRHFERSKSSSFRFSTGEFLKDIKPSLRVILASKLIYLRAFVLFLVILACARPQSVLEGVETHVEGVDIVLVVDTSTSMRAMDFEIGARRVDRLEVVKNVVSDFIKKRPTDRIGMVAFSALAYTICPLTLDHDWLERNLERVNIGMIKDGTAIGVGLTAALNRLKQSNVKEKVIILLTDGRNNAGRISPLAASEVAKVMGIRVYTIGAGTKGLAPYPVKDMFGNTVLTPLKIDIDDELLTKIADMTGGVYFRATDTEELKEIYNRIDELEKTPIEETGYRTYKELFMYLVAPALVLLVLEIFLANTILRSLP